MAKSLRIFSSFMTVGPGICTSALPLNMYTYLCVTPEHVYVPLRRPRTCIRTSASPQNIICTSVSPQNMYTYLCVTPEHVYVPLRRPRTCIRTSASPLNMDERACTLRRSSSSCVISSFCSLTVLHVSLYCSWILLYFTGIKKHKHVLCPQL